MRYAKQPKQQAASVADGTKAIHHHNGVLFSLMLQMLLVIQPSAVCWWATSGVRRSANRIFGGFRIDLRRRGRLGQVIARNGGGSGGGHIKRQKSKG